MFKIDLNCDLGESFGLYIVGSDKKILNSITSANIACGFHAGDPSTMHQTVKMAIEKGVGIGAHPGLPDLLGFGRRNMDVSPQEVYDMVVYQIGALYGFVKVEGGELQHVKPHGALYNMAAKNPVLAKAIAQAVYKVDPTLILFALSGSELIKAGAEIGLQTASEVFADRTYQQNGTLTPRQHPDALITDCQQAIQQVVRMVKEGKVRSLNGVDVEIKADTVCIHGDGPDALQFASQIKECLQNSQISLQRVRKIQ